MTRGFGWSARLLCVSGLLLSACVGAVGGDEENQRTTSDAFDPGSGTPGQGDPCEDPSELCDPGTEESSPNTFKPEDEPPGCDPAPEDCDNGRDDDCDELVDGDDPDCDPPECVPSPEDCDNGIDDDCDELVDDLDDDCTCTWTEVVCGIPNCNSHLGDDEQACYAAGNSGGCTPQQLEAWCTRRVNEGPTGLWYLIHEWWVAANCNGEVQYQDINGKGYYTCVDDETCTTYECVTPLVFVFDVARAVAYVVDDGLTSFDLSASGDGSAVRTDWPSAASPWLALDRDGNGRIDSGRELFGSATPTLAGIAQNGFEALAALDDDDSGVIDAGDAAYAHLLVWADANHDRISQPHELRILAELGVTSLQLDAMRVPRCNERGNCEIERAPFHWRSSDGNEHQGALVDVHLAVRR